ncbi:hypothetical protein ACS0TY_018892 [Phlomoides rotata]
MVRERSSRRIEDNMRGKSTKGDYKIKIHEHRRKLDGTPNHRRRLGSIKGEKNVKNSQTYYRCNLRTSIKELKELQFVSIISEK